ncbi:MAG: hypothetical protein AAGC46_02280 [Solirubrobacteraceae bacterium]
MTFVLIVVGAALAVAVELLEALAIVLAVGVSRRWSDALVGAAAGVVVCAVVAGVVGPLLLGNVPIGSLRLVIGVLLMLFGLEWLRKNTLRLAGRKAPASSLAEFVETQEALEQEALPPAGEPDWAARAIAFKGVLLEGLEVVLIVAALAARPSGPAPALLGAALAVVVVLGLAAWIRRPLEQLHETDLKWGVGVLLTAFGLFFAGEGLHAHWPGDDLAVVYVAVVLAFVTRVHARVIAARVQAAEAIA